MICQRLFLYKTTRRAYLTSRHWKKVRVVFKYRFQIYGKLQKIFSSAPQFSGLGPATSSLSWPLLAPRQPKDAGRPCLQATSASPSPAPWIHTGQLAEHTGTKAMSTGWIKIPNAWKTFSSRSYSCRMEVEAHRTKYSDLYCFVCKAAATGAYFDKKVWYCLGYTQSRHTWSQRWQDTCSSQGIPAGGKQVSDALLPTHHKNSTVLPKRCARLLLSGHSGYSQHYAISFGLTYLTAGTQSLHPLLLAKQLSSDILTKGMIATFVFTQRWCPWNVGVSSGCGEPPVNCTSPNTTNIKHPCLHKYLWWRDIDFCCSNPSFSS